MALAPTIEELHAIPTAAECQYWLYNRFDETSPPDWADEAIKRIDAMWAEEDKWDEMPDRSIFWSRVFVTLVVLIASAVMGLNHVF